MLAELRKIRVVQLVFQRIKRYVIRWRILWFRGMNRGNRSRRVQYSLLRNTSVLAACLGIALCFYFGYDSRDGFLANPFVQPWIPAIVSSCRIRPPNRTHSPYLQEFKNPCYLARDEALVFGEALATAEQNRKSALQYPTRVQVLESTGAYSNDVLRCVPYYLVLGWAKSGTSDMFEKMMAHPLILRPPVKEPAWLNNHRSVRQYVINTSSVSIYRTWHKTV